MGRKCVVCGIRTGAQAHESFHRFPANTTRRKAWLQACGLQEAQFNPNFLVCSRHFRLEDFDDSVFPQRKLFVTAIPAPTLPCHASKMQQQQCFDRTVPSVLPLVKKELQESVEQTCSGVTDSSVYSHLPLVKEELQLDPNSIQQQTCFGIIDSSVHPHFPFVKKELQEDPIDNKAHARQLVDAETQTETRNVPWMCEEDYSSAPRYLGDLQVTHFSSPKRAKRNLAFVKRRVQQQKTKINVLHQKVRRLTERLKSV